MLIIFGILLIIFILFCYLDKCQKQRVLEKFGEVDCEPYLPIIGCCHQFILKGKYKYITYYECILKG